MSRKKIIVGNWKMNPPTLEFAKAIFSKVKRVSGRLRRTEVVLCPSFVHLASLRRVSSGKNLSLGAQDIFEEPEGAFTGEVSAVMVSDAGASFVILGHSEKRKRGDSNAIVAQKLELCLRRGLKAIVCIGEKERDRDGRFFEELKTQILETFERVPRGSLSRKVIIAYEPLWAIGKNDFKAMNPSDVHETSIFIRKIINDKFGPESSELPILYGGSVTSENASSIVYKGVIDGLLVGRESLDPQKFSEILLCIDKDYGKGE